MFLVRSKDGCKQVEFRGKYTIGNYADGGTAWLHIEDAVQFVCYPNLAEAKAEVEKIIDTWIDYVSSWQDSTIIYTIGGNKALRFDCLGEVEYE